MAAVLFLLSWTWKISGNSLPPLGGFFNPVDGFYRISSDLENEWYKVQVNAPSTVYIDHRGVPHIFSSSIKDAYFTLGFLHAKDRLWQIDLSSRASAGRLAEVLGERLVPHDSMQRIMGMEKSAEAAMEIFKNFPQSHGWLSSYVKGLNAYLHHLKDDDLKKPVEYNLLNYSPPENFTALDVALIYQSLIKQLNFRADDIELTNLAKIYPLDFIQCLFPDDYRHESPVIGRKTDHTLDTAIHDPTPGTDPGIGSNNLAVAGSKTKTGNPILASDPHLPLNLPSLFYEVQIHTPEMNVYGISIAGIPGIIIGFNEHLAWGLTNAGHDVLDFVFVSDSTMQTAKIAEERIQVKNNKTRTVDVAWTRYGPTFEYNKRKIAIKWLGHLSLDSFDVMSVLTNINLASGISDFQNALEEFTQPAHNFAYADTEGNIGLFIKGVLPIRSDSTGKFIYREDETEAGWPEFIPIEELPAEVNPEKGYLSSANQRSTGFDYPYYYHGYFANYRGRRLGQALGSMDNITVNDIMVLQKESYSLLAEETITFLDTSIKEKDLSGEAQEWLHRLKGWDRSFKAESKEAVWIHYWLKSLDKIVYDEIPYRMDRYVYPEEWVTYKLLSEETPCSPVIDITTTEKKESKEEILIMAFEAATDSSNLFMLNYKGEYPWGDLRSSSIEHLARIPAFGRSLTAASGHFSSLNALKVKSGPSWRMIVELSNPPQGFGILPGGVSGDPGSPFYDNAIDDYIEGKYYPLEFFLTPKEAEASALYTIKLINQ